MATVPYIQAEQVQKNVLLHKWSLTSANFDGQPLQAPGAPDRCHQELGTFGGATVIWQGSLDGGVTWFQLHDASNTLISSTAAAGGSILEGPLLIRPFLSVVGVAAAIDCYLFGRVAA